MMSSSIKISVRNINEHLKVFKEFNLGAVYELPHSRLVLYLRMKIGMSDPLAASKLD